MSSKYLKVDGDNSVVRDSTSNGILNVDEKSYLAHRKKIELSKRKRDVEVNSEIRINNIEQKLEVVESTLSKILDILTNGKS